MLGQDHGRRSGAQGGQSSGQPEQRIAGDNGRHADRATSHADG
jgi:hypothetical protein